MEQEYESGAAVLSPLASEPRLDWVMCASVGGTHRMAYWEWGDPHNDRVLLCVHGLTGNGRDFDALAQRMSAQYRVVAPDIVGRGRSDWLHEPGAYTVMQYVADILVLLARVKASHLDWVGTSMGGLIALGLQAGLLGLGVTPHQASFELGLPDSARLSLGKLVLNDVGPSLNVQGIQRIADNLAQQPVFDTYAQVLAYVQATAARLGLPAEQPWEHIIAHQYREREGRWHRHYDSRLAVPFRHQAESDLQQAQALLWGAFGSWPAPVLILHGVESDLLSAEQVEQMLKAQSTARVHHFPGVGHAPSLRLDTELDIIERFLLEKA